MHGNFIEKLVKNGLTFTMKFPFYSDFFRNKAI